MEPLNEALSLLYESLSRLENKIEKITETNSILLSHAIQQKEKNDLLESKKTVALQELYALREMIQKELQIEVSKDIVDKKKNLTPSILMLDDEE